VKLHKKETNGRFLRDFKAPMDFLNALWTDTIVSHICASTQKFYVRGKQVKLTPDQLRKFIGLELMRGVIGIRNLEYMWRTEEIIIQYPGKENSLSKALWYKVSATLSFDPNWLHEKLTTNFQTFLVPGYNILIDEIRIPVGHEDCPVKNHNRDKPDIWAIESKSMHADNGYLIDFINPFLEEVPTPGESVFQFAEVLKKSTRRHHIVCDSNFLSALDILKLHDMGFEATCSCKSNRPSFIWKDGLAKKLPRGYTRIASSQRMCCVATRNQGIPKLATTLCTAVEEKNYFTSKERRAVLNIYDDIKGKADYFGHLYKAQYPMGHHKCWSTTVMLGWFYFTLTNSFILYKMYNGTLTHSQYVYQIAKEYMCK
jgi:hypothetical protein